ncbi:nitrite reductase small subunit NirD [Acidiferrobacter sp.]
MTWRDVAGLADIPPLGGRVLVTPTGEIALLRNEDGEVFALDNHCPHKGGPLAEGTVTGYTVHCPLHGWRIDLSSGQARDPDCGSVRTWDVRIEGDRILLRLPR